MNRTPLFCKILLLILSFCSSAFSLDASEVMKSGPVWHLQGHILLLWHVISSAQWLRCGSLCCRCHVNGCGHMGASLVLRGFLTPTSITSAGFQEQRFWVWCGIFCFINSSTWWLFLLLIVLPAFIMRSLHLRCHSRERLCITLNGLRVSSCQKQLVELSAHWDVLAVKRGNVYLTFFWFLWVYVQALQNSK